METFHLWNEGLIISPRKRFPLRKKYSLQQQNCVQLIFPYLPCNRTMGLPSAEIETGLNSVAKPNEFVPKPFLACLTFFVTLENTRNFGE